MTAGRDDDDDRHNHMSRTEAGHEYLNPVDRFWQLPEATRRWLEGLREEDIREWQDAMKLKRRVEAGGWFIKWSVITIAASFVGAAAFGDAAQKILKWFTNAGH